MLSEDHRRILGELYEQSPLTLDNLPYTKQYEALHIAFVARTKVEITRHELWRALTNLRKAGKLARKER